SKGHWQAYDSSALLNPKFAIGLAARCVRTSGSGHSSELSAHGSHSMAAAACQNATAAASSVEARFSIRGSRRAVVGLAASNRRHKGFNRKYLLKVALKQLDHPLVEGKATPGDRSE